LCPFLAITQALRRQSLCSAAGVKQGVFIERDGILNRARVERGQPVAPLVLREFHPHREIAPLLNELKAAGLLLIVTTNQPALSRGELSRRELDRMHQILRETFPIDDILVCPHEEMDGCTCRKPKSGLLVEGAFKWRLDLSRSFVISDKWQDAEAARRAGVTSVLLASPWLGDGHHDFVLPDLPSLIEKILQLTRPMDAVVA
jgi:D-glycero-D-manno-heptose 1,7-bisphosphate phosphatase